MSNSKFKAIMFTNPTTLGFGIGIDFSPGQYYLVIGFLCWQFAIGFLGEKIDE